MEFIQFPKIPRLSRNCIVTDGFARWVRDHEEELVKLGNGRHFGEWWGPGIQRGYGLKERVLSLFNVARHSESVPACCRVVPVLWKGHFDEFDAKSILAKLEREGSVASPGFMRPEGIIVCHQGCLFKRTLDNDAVPKSLAVTA